MKKMLILTVLLLLSITAMVYLSSCGAGANADKMRHYADSLRMADSIAATSMPHFPWPPPKSSASVKIPRSIFIKPGQSITLSQLSQEFEMAMNKAGYSSLSYFYVPCGFAIVSQLEQINPDGSPKKETERWSAQYQKAEVFDLSSYISALFTSKPGHFRVIAFIFSTQPFTQTAKEMSKDTAAILIHRGATGLSPKIEDFPVPESFNCNALIYEFEQKSMNSLAVFKDPSSVNGKNHLVKSKIWGELVK